VDTPGIRSVAKELAPHLDMQPEQFLNLSLHPTCDSLMPAEHASAAAVYLALRLADEFHGQVGNGYEVLERAGLLRPPAEPLALPEQPEDLPDAAAVERLELVRQLEQVLVEAGAEFNRLPAFVRPLARNGFKVKAGRSLAAWQRELAELRASLETELLPATCS
jgi:hypothetical protein